MKLYLKQFFSLLLSLVFLGSLLSGCSPSSMDPDQPLSVYYGDSLNTGGSEILEKYNRTIGESDRSIEIIDTEEQNLNTEILAGNGPDIFVFDETGLENYLSYANEGVFEDLSPYFEKDNTISLDNYNQKILNYGVIEGKRYFIPLGYQIENLVFTSRQTLEYYGLDSSVELSLSNLGEYLSNVSSKNDGQNVYLFDNFEYLKNLLLNSSIDSKTGTPSFSNDTFLKNAESIQHIFSQNTEMLTTETILQALKNRNLVFMSGYQEPLLQGASAAGINLIFRSSAVINQSSDNIIPKGIQLNESENKYYANPRIMVAINSNCKDKEQAFQFVKYLLSDSVQNWDSIQEQGFGGFPVNNTSFEEVKKILQNDKITFKNDLEYEKYLSSCYEIVENISECRSVFYNATYAREIFDPLFDEYVNGKISVDEFVSQLDNRTELYLQE